jgi:hypothetical protein
MDYITSVGVQQFSITIPSSSTTATATITAVGSGAFILFDGINPSVAASPANDFASVTLTNSTTITATRNSGSSGSVLVTGCIIDGSSNLINSVQYGTVTVSSTSGTATISAVTNANTAIHLLGWQSSNTTLSGINEFPVLSLSGTTVTASRNGGTTGTLTVGFVAIEFKGTALNQSVQNIAATSSSSVTSYTAALTSVNTSNTISIYAGSNIATVTTDIAEIKQYGQLTSSTVLTVHVNTAIAQAKNYNCSVVEFISGLLKSSVQRGTTTVTGTLSNTSTLSSITQIYSGLSWLGNTSTATTAVLNEAEGSSSLGLTTSVPAIVNDTFVAATSSFTQTIPSTTAGNLLLLTFIMGGGSPSTVTSITDNLSQTYIQVPSAQGSDTTNNKTTDIWYCPNTLGGVTSITSSASTGTTQLSVDIIEVSNVRTVSPIDSSNSTSNATFSSNSALSSAVTTTSVDDFIATVVSTSFTNVLSPYAFTASGPTAWRVPSVLVTGNQANFQTATSTGKYASSSVAFLPLVSQTVKVTKSSAVANITGSWEVFEFPTPGANVGSAAGTSTVTGVGQELFSAAGSAAGTSTISASSLFGITASAAGTSTAQGNAGFIGSAAGTSTVTGAGSSQNKSVGSAAGTSTVIGSSSPGQTVGTIAGTSSVLAFSNSIAQSPASASGSSTVQAFGALSAATAGTAAGNSTATGFGLQKFLVVGTSSATSTVLGIGASLTQSFAVAHAAGTSLVTSDVTPQFNLDLLGGLNKYPVNCLAELSNDPVSLLGTF